MVLTKNIRALARYNPHLSTRLLKYIPNHSKLIKTRDESYTLEIAEGESSYLLHSKYRPVQEAQRQVADFAYRVGDTLVVAGLGLGHTLKILEKDIYTPTVVFIIESDIEILYRACEVTDFTALFSRENTYLSIGDDPHLCAPIIHSHVHSWAMIPLSTLHLPVTLQRHGAFYAAVSTVLKNEIYWAGTALKTAVDLAVPEMANRVAMAPWYFASTSLVAYKDVFKGCKGVVLGAGPSLAPAIATLRKSQEDVVICCVGTALKVLVSHGIIPDVVVTLDYNALSAHYLTGLEELLSPEEMPLLVIDPRSNTASLKTWKGPLCFVPESRTEWLRNDFKTVSPIETGSSVGIMAFTTLSYCGVDEIALIGMDLSNPYGVTHMPGVDHYDMWYGSLNRFSRYEMLEWEQILRFRSELELTHDADGTSVYSDTLLLSYLHELERAIAAHIQAGGSVYDCGRGGAYKQGTMTSDILSFIETCQQNVPRLETSYPLKDTSQLSCCMLEFKNEIKNAQSLKTLQLLEDYLATHHRLRSFLYFIDPEMVLQRNAVLRQQTLDREQGLALQLQQDALEQNALEHYENMQRSLIKLLRSLGRSS